MATTPVTFDAVPVVFWLNVGHVNVPVLKLPEDGVPSAGVVNVGPESVGLVASTTAPEPVEVVTPVPPLATGSVPVTWVVRFTSDKAPPSVMLPDDVTVPDKEMPFTVPVPATEVTLPVPDPAPMAVRKVAASIVVIVLFALIWTKRIALGLASVKKLPPTVVAPKFVRAAAAVVAPLPPLASATVPVTFAAVPVVFWLNVGHVKVPELKLPEAGVPRMGAVNVGVVIVGEVANTNAPVPVEVEVPVPPDAAANGVPRVNPDR